MRVSELAIRRPVTTAMFFLGMSLLGFVSLDRLSVELLPQVIFPEIFVAISQRTLSPEQVERELLLPAEAEIATLSGLAALESSAGQGRATLQISFAPGTDMKFAVLQVQGRMDRLQPLLPEQTQIVVQRLDTSILTSAVMELQVLGEGDLNWLREYAELNIRPELESVDGVVSAAVLGGQRRAVEVILDLDAIEAFGISPNRLRTAINAVNRPRAYLGEVYDGGLAYPVSVQGQATELSQLRNIIVDTDIGLRLGDVSQVRYGLQRRTDLSRVNGLSSVGVRILKEDEANLIDVADEIVATVGRLNAELAPAGIVLLISNSQADLIQTALGTLVQAAIAGLLLGLCVLFLFLRNVRFVAVLLIAIPASLLLTFNMMYASDLSLNVLSLCGLALAIGMLADNSIVVMESIFKQFERGKPPAIAARDGTAAVSRAVIASTATTVLVFVPVVFVQSDFQEVLRDLALAIAFPLGVSLLIALTLVPMLGARALAHTRVRPLNTGGLMAMYTILLKAGLRHRIRVTVAVGVALLFTVVVAFFLLLQQQAVQTESQFTVYVDMPEGATLDATDISVTQLETAVAELPGIDGFTSSVQEGQGAITVQLLDRAERPGQIGIEGIKSQLAVSFDRLVDAVVSYDPPGAGGARSGGGGGRGGAGGGEFGMLGGAPPEVAIIRGQDFATLQMIAEDLVYRLEEIEDVDADTVQPDVQRSAPEVQILPDAVAMFDRQIQISTLLTAVGDADSEGFATATGFLEADGTETVIEVRPTENPETEGLRLADLRQLPVPTPSGSTIPLTEVARVRTDEGRRSILRTDQTRRVLVEYRYLDEVLKSQPRLDSARRLVRTTVQQLGLPSGYTIEIVEGEVDSVYYWMMGIAAILVYMTLAALFESFSAPLVVFGTLPPAAIGACWALMLTGTGLTSQAGPMALLGLIVLIGIAVNNGIILIDAISELRHHHGYRLERAVMTAGRSRVRPILMTSATTLLGVAPLALQMGGDYEIWPPFAITILGGLSVSMVSTLIFVPVAYMGIDQVTRWLRGIGWIGVGAASLATLVAAWQFDRHYQNAFWLWLLVLPTWFGLLAVVWIAQQAVTLRVSRHDRHKPIHSVRLRTLTKIYDASGQFGREWGRFGRRARLRFAAGRQPFDRRAIAESFTWKIPMLGLIVALQAYIQDQLWLYVLAFVTWGLLLDLSRGVIVLWRTRPATDGALPDPDTTARLPWIARITLAAAFFATIQLRLGLLSLTVTTAILWALLAIVRTLGTRVSSGKVHPDRLSGKFRRLRRFVYTTVGKIPLIGTPKRPFTALIGVNLEIERGMFGLLGPNGAGKTTLMRIVCRVLAPTHGSVEINGVRVENLGGLHGVIGYLPQRFGLYDHMSAFEYLEYRALLEGFRDRTEREERVRWCLEQVHLLDRQHDAIGSFSGGMRQRVGIAQTLLHTPQIIVVDEPTAGLDPIERIRFRNLLARLSQDRIVIFSTHIVEDVAGSCNALAVLNEGRVLYSGEPEVMRNLAQGRVWEAVVDEAGLDALETATKVITQLRTAAGLRARFLAREPLSGIVARRVEPTLEDAYVYLLERHRGLAW